MCNDIQHYDNFIVIRNVLLNEEIRILFDFFNTTEIGHTIHNNNWDVNSDKKTKISNSNREVEIIGLPYNKFEFLTQKLLDCFSCVIENPKLESPHYFTRYNIGGKHALHYDFINTFDREWVLSLVLNDDYEGGDLVINGEIVPHEKNIAILYSGALKHEVKSVTFGSRFVITECATKNLKKL
jgi:hypothetical protein